MNICMFTNTYWPHVGGVARSVRFFTEDLLKKGHRVLIVAPEYESEETDPEPGDYEIFRVPAWQNFNGSDFSLSMPIPFVLDQKVEAFQPDIIHSHHPYLLGDDALRAARKRHLPLVFTHHTLYEEYTHYTPAESDGMKRFVISLSTEYANLCSQIIAPSESIKRLIRERGVAAPIEVIPTGVDVDVFSAGDGARFRRDHGLPEDALVIGHLGRLAPEKNLEYLARAVALFLGRRREAHFLVVGEGPSASEMAEICQQSGVGDRIHLPGNAGGRDLVDAYHAMDLFVFASKSETQGMVLTEAMAAGKPVIALDAPGAREVVVDGENGRLLPEDASTKDFVQAMDAFTENREKAAAWKQRARATAQNFSREAMVETLEDVYRQNMAAYKKLDSDIREDALLWSSVLQRIETEWTLLAEKASAVIQAVSQNGLDGE